MSHLINHRRYCKEFEEFIAIKGYARGKKSDYPRNIHEFLCFIENRDTIDINKVVTSDVIQYYEYLKERPNRRRLGHLSTSTINGHLFSLRLFFDYLMDAGDLVSSPCHLPRMYKGKCGPREILTEREIKEVIGYCVNWMEKSLIAIAYGCGLRRSEIVQLDVKDVILSKGILAVRNGKGCKSRIVPMSDKGIKMLKRYLIKERSVYFPQQEANISSAFFMTVNCNRMNGNQLNLMLKGILKRTGNHEILEKKISLHSLRHSIATHLQDHGAEVEFVKDFLGHSVIDTTILYARRRKIRVKIYNSLKADHSADK